MRTGFITLVDRELYRFVRLFRQTIIPPVITTSMFVLIFGFSLGSRIREIEGFSYIVFILPGLLQMGVITNAYANSSTSLYMARLERSIENILTAPLTYFEIVTAYLIGGMLRGVVVASTILAVAFVLIPVPFKHPLTIIFAIFFTSLIFSGLGIISALYAENWDKIGTFTNFVITPFVYLGGVFYSIHMLPPFWYKISHFNLIFYCVDLIRYGFLGISDVPIEISYTVITVSSILIYATCVYLFRIGYKLVN